jgi:phospholipase C
MEMAARWKQVAIIACLSLLLIAPTTGKGAVPTTATPIQHVIIIMQENHSFDNYFGTYPTANGTLVTPITSSLPTVTGIPDSVCLPFNGGCVSPRLTTATAVTNPAEGQLVYEADYSGNGTGFPANSGVQSMVYFDYHSIPAYWDYAEEYGLADNYYSAFLTQSNPNRLALLTGDSPVSSDNGPPPYTPYNETLMSQLDAAGVSWGYYDYVTANSSQSIVKPLNYISGMTERAVSRVGDLSSLYRDLSNGTGLPSVSFVNSLGDKTYDEHPPSNPTTGEQWVVSVVDDVMRSTYWGSTAIFITWDEGGGFYDQVVPPVEFTVNHGFQSPLLGLGQRVPLLVVSPYSKEAYVSNTLMSHLSLTHFIEYNWNLPPLDANVANSNLPLGFFNFSQPPRPPLILGTSGPFSMSTYPVPLQVPLSQTTATRPTDAFGLALANASLLALCGLLVAISKRRGRLL